MLFLSGNAGCKCDVGAFLLQAQSKKKKKSLLNELPSYMWTRPYFATAISKRNLAAFPNWN